MQQQKYFKQALALVAGFLTIFILNAVSRLFVFQKVKGFTNGSSTIDTTVYNSVLHTMTALFIPIIGGIVVGYIVKKKGAYFGGALAIILKMISVGVICTLFIYPPAFYGIQLSGEAARTYALQNLSREFISLPFAILFMAWGGWVGEKLAQFTFLPKRTSQ
ncbi:hypothetical protein KAZ66_00715 [Candidatus Woesebacteria bacterium]|nr:hypothetical protein [Candidatus Woesebacteria bacterium]